MPNFFPCTSIMLVTKCCCFCLRVLLLKRAAEEKVRAIRAAAASSFKSMLKEKGDINVNSRWSRVCAIQIRLLVFLTFWRVFLNIKHLAYLLSY